MNQKGEDFQYFLLIKFYLGLCSINLESDSIILACPAKSEGYVTIQSYGIMGGGGGGGKK